MLHKVVDFTQTILGTIALTGIIAFTVITVNALNPSVNTSTTTEGQVAGITTINNTGNTLPVQIINSINNDTFKGTLSYVSDNKSTYKLEVPSLKNSETFEFISVDNLNHTSSSFNLSVFTPQLLSKRLKVEVLDNVNTLELNSTPRSFVVDSTATKVLKIKLSPLENINFPFVLEFEITQ